MDPSDPTEGLEVGQPGSEVASASAKTRKRWWIAGVLGAFLLMLAGAGYLGLIALANRDSASKWRNRSHAVENVLDSRTRALNRQTVRLNRTAVTLRKAQRAIARSESAVASL